MDGTAFGSAEPEPSGDRVAWALLHAKVNSADKSVRAPQEFPPYNTLPRAGIP